MCQTVRHRSRQYQIERRSPLNLIASRSVACFVASLQNWRLRSICEAIAAFLSCTQFPDRNMQRPAAYDQSPYTSPAMEFVEHWLEVRMSTRPPCLRRNQ